MSKSVKTLLQDVIKSFGPEGSEVATFAALQAVAAWSETEKIHAITIPLDESFHELFEKRLKVLKKRGLVPDNLTFTLQNTAQAA